MVDLVAGWISGGVSIFCSQPIDTILTRKQAGGSLSFSTSHNSVKSLIGNHGISSLWRGSSAMIGAIPLQNGMLMAGYGIGKRFVEGERNPNASDGNMLLGVFIGGCTGGLVQSFLMSPVELIKVSQQVGGESFVSAATIVSTNLLSRNVGWKGLEATILRDGIPHGVWFAAYEYTKSFLERRQSSMDLDGQTLKSSSSSSCFIPLFSGAVAACMAWGVGYPFDIIKTRIQASPEQMTVFNATQAIIRESNHRPIPALYKGFGLKLAKAVPASAINFFIYELVANRMKDIGV